MNHIRVEIGEGNQYHSGGTIALSVDGGNPIPSTFSIESYARARGRFDTSAAEFAYFTTVVYACDRAVKRDSISGDRWTREFLVEVPVADTTNWNSASSEIERAIEFLTGDIWHFDFIPTQRSLFNREFNATRRRFRKRKSVRGEAVSLFSGGLDSLVGVIDWLENNPEGRILLASTYDGQAEGAKGDQKRLLPALMAEYPDRITWKYARTGLVSGGEDTNFRSRSLAFIGNALLAASFLGEGTDILIPENGAIALNYPLTPSRRGSLSTRTVNPQFIALLQNMLDALGFNYPLENIYRHMTKGEMLQECKNMVLLTQTYQESASCGKRGHRKNWDDRQARQCGACIPCMFRRAAVAAVGLSTENFGHDLSSPRTLNRLLSKPNRDLPSLIDFVTRSDDSEAIRRTLMTHRHFPTEEIDEYVTLVSTLRTEVESWLADLNLLR